MLDGLLLQNVKAVFDAAIKVVLQPPKSKKKKKKSQSVCSVLWSRKEYAFARAEGTTTSYVLAFFSAYL